VGRPAGQGLRVELSLHGVLGAIGIADTKDDQTAARLELVLRLAGECHTRTDLRTVVAVLRSVVLRVGIGFHERVVVLRRAECQVGPGARHGVRVVRERVVNADGVFFLIVGECLRTQNSHLIIADCPGDRLKFCGFLPQTDLAGAGRRRGGRGRRAPGRGGRAGGQRDCGLPAAGQLVAALLEHHGQIVRCEAELSVLQGVGDVLAFDRERSGLPREVGDIAVVIGKFTRSVLVQVQVHRVEPRGLQIREFHCIIVTLLDRVDCVVARVLRLAAAGAESQQQECREQQRQPFSCRLFHSSHPFS